MIFKTSKAKIKSVIDPSVMRSMVSAGLIKESRLEQIALDPGCFYLDAWAVSALEKWGCNENFDGFERAELHKSFSTFIGAWSCLNHQNQHVSLAVGTIPDAIYTPDDYVRIVHAIDRKKAEARHPSLETKIANKEITDTSMGCFARESVCSISKCANVATDETQFCDHIQYHRGKKLCNADTNWNEVIAFEINRGCVFFEDSIITDDEGADRNAKILNKLAQHNRLTSPKSVPVDTLYRFVRDMAKTASLEERAVLTTIVEHLMRVMDEQ